jgi:hypothetical protein
MEIHVIGGKEIWAARDDAVSVLVSAAAHGESLPHELFHYVVEDSLALEWGYWDCIAKGALFSGMSLRSAPDERSAQERANAVAAEAGKRADDAEFFVAAVDAAFEAGLEDDVEKAKALVRRQWAHLSCPPLEIADLVGLKDRVGDLTERWRRLGEGETLELPWPSPEAGKMLLR